MSAQTLDVDAEEIHFATTRVQDDTVDQITFDFNDFGQQTTVDFSDIIFDFSNSQADQAVDISQEVLSFTRAGVDFSIVVEEVIFGLQAGTNNIVAESATFEIVNQSDFSIVVEEVIFG